MPNIVPSDDGMGWASGWYNSSSLLDFARLLGSCPVFNLYEHNVTIQPLKSCPRHTRVVLSPISPMVVFSTVTSMPQLRLDSDVI